MRAGWEVLWRGARGGVGRDNGNAHVPPSRYASYGIQTLLAGLTDMVKNRVYSV